MILATGLALAVSICGTPGVAAGEAPLGSADFRPSPERPVGWRGDGNGKYPGATPPVHWNQSLKQLAEFKCAAAIPKDNSSSGATPATTGFFSEWLVAGPISCVQATNAIKDEFLSGEASFAPLEGDKLEGTAWRKVNAEDSFIDLFRSLGKMTNTQAAYVQSCLFVEKPTKIWFHFSYASRLAFWLNGKLVHANTESAAGAGSMGPTLELNLQAGWNRFLFKLTPRFIGGDDFPPTCYVRCRFWPADEPREYERKNIAWITPMPGLSQAMPIVVDDLIFTTAHPYNLVCLDKKSGKILWIRSNSPYDAATAEDRKTKPELFARLDDLAKKREAYYNAFVSGTLATNQTVKDETALEAEMDKLMVDVDQRYKRPVEQGEPDWWAIPTPASDGRSVFVFMTRGVSAAYDLKGKRRWIRYETPKHQHHGFFGSPVIAGNKFVILDGTVTALDLSDGSAKWSVGLDDPAKTKGWRIWFGSLSRCMIGGEEYVLCPGGNIVIRAGDGKVFGSQGWGNFDATPVFQYGAAWQTFMGTVSQHPINSATNGGVILSTAKGVTLNDVRQNFLGLNFYQGHFFEASPLIHDGIGYVVTCNGVLMVFDVATLESVYRQELPLDLFYGAHQRQFMGASVTLAGQYIYLMGSTGVTLVIKPGRKYEEVARNRIQNLARSDRALGDYRYYAYNPKYCPEYQDGTMTSTPVFDGDRMYFRGMESLYCVK